MRLTPETLLPAAPVLQANRLLEVPINPKLGLCIDRLFVEQSAYDAFVCWDRVASVEHDIVLDETTRLARLIADACAVVPSGGGGFVTRAVHSKRQEPEKRHLLNVNRRVVGAGGEKLRAWVIEP